MNSFMCHKYIIIAYSPIGLSEMLYVRATRTAKYLFIFLPSFDLNTANLERQCPFKHTFYTAYFLVSPN